MLHYAKRHHVPLAWTRETYVQAGAEDLGEQQEPFGYRTGVTGVIHLLQGRHFLYGVNRDQDLPLDSDEIMRIVAAIQLFTTYAQEPALKLMFPEKLDGRDVHLTARELEVMRWTMEGKTAWEVSVIINISEWTVKQHLSNVIEKLHCVNKHQAVAKAIRLGLLD